MDVFGKTVLTMQNGFAGRKILIWWIPKCITARLGHLLGSKKMRDATWIFNVNQRWYDHIISDVNSSSNLQPLHIPHCLCLGILYIYCFLKHYCQIRSFAWIQIGAGCNILLCHEPLLVTPSSWTPSRHASLISLLLPALCPMSSLKDKLFHRALLPD